MTTPMPGTSRRSFVRTAVWTAPAVTVVASAPAWAASTPMASFGLTRRSPATTSARAFDPGQAQIVSVTVRRSSDGSPVVGRAVTFTLPTSSASWLRLVDDAGASQVASVVVTDDRGVATAPLRVVATSDGSPATVVASSDDSSGTADPVSWTFVQATGGLAPSGPVGFTGKFTGAHLDGRAFTWGTQAGGQLGIGTSASTAFSAEAVSATAPSSLAGRSVVALAAGDEHMLALTTDGVVHTWGRSTYGQRGDGSVGTDLLVPGTVSATGASSLAGRTVVAVAAGSFFSLALASDGTVHAWGRNDAGQLGDGAVITPGDTSINRSVPVQVLTTGSSSLAGRRVVAIAAGNGHSIALDSDGNVHTWGRNASGILGQGTTGGTVSTPGRTASTTGTAAGVTAVAAGANYSLALVTDGTVHTWGTNAQGQLGSSVGATSSTPTPVDTGTQSSLNGRSVVAIAGGQQHALAIASDGTVHTWGANGAGQLGWGGTTNQRVPGAVATDGSSSLAGRTIVAASGMRNTSHVLTADDTFHSWGFDTTGERGDGAGDTTSGTPGLVVGIA